MAREENKASDFVQGARSAIGVAVGYVPIGMAYGVLARSVGLSFLETVGMSLMVYAGASQFVALNLIALGVNPFQIVFAVFMVNIRHFLMSTSLSGKIGQGSRTLKALFSFGITDETFAVASLREDVTPSFMFGLISISYSSWVTSSGVGYVFGKGLPLVLKQGMSVALYALFIGLLVPSLRKSKMVFLIAGIAGGLNSGLMLVLSTGWAIVIASLVAAVIGTLLEEGRPWGETGGASER